MSKVHDKIYMDPIGGWDTKPIPDCVDNIYIRKDALVEFCNNKLQESADRLDFHTNRAYAELIDHINKM